MASIESRNGKNFRIVFRYQGQRYSKSLGTNDESIATSLKTSLEQRLQLVATNMLPAPSESDDVAEYLISGNSKPTRKMIDRKSKSKPLRFGGLCETYLEDFLTSSVEPNTFGTMNTHISHLGRIIGDKTKVLSLDYQAVQKYINKRAEESGRRNANVSPVTIKKEITTLKGIVRWGIDSKFIDQDFNSKRLRYPKGEQKPPFQTLAEIQRKLQRSELTKEEQVDLWHCLFLSTEQVASLLISTSPQVSWCYEQSVICLRCA